jgi:DNA-binding response OmpR family regulator
MDAVLRPANEGGARILVVEDDRPCAELIADVLREAGHQARTVCDARIAVQTAVAWRPDVVVLDLVMPFVDGISVCLALRQRLACRILIVSAKADPSDRALGLRVGADDYLGKPFDASELEARVAALVRRARQSLHQTERRIGDLVLDRRAKRATVHGVTLDLTPTEFRLVDLLTGELGRLFTREELLAQVWDGRISGPSRAVDVHLGRLRRKLEHAAVRGFRVCARRGFGYVAVVGDEVPLPLLGDGALSAA